MVSGHPSILFRVEAERELGWLRKTGTKKPEWSLQDIMLMMIMTTLLLIWR